MYNDRDIIYGALAVIEDIAERKKKPKRACGKVRSDSAIRLNSYRKSVFEVDTEGIITFANEQAFAANRLHSGGFC